MEKALWYQICYLLCTFQQELLYVVHTYILSSPPSSPGHPGSTSKTLARVAKREVSFDVDLSHVCSQAALRIGKRPPSQISQPISNRLVRTRFVQGFSDFQAPLDFFRLVQQPVHPNWSKFCAKNNNSRIVCSQEAVRIGKRPPSQISQPISNRLVRTRFVQGFSDFQAPLDFFRLVQQPVHPNWSKFCAKNNNSGFVCSQAAVRIGKRPPS